MRTNSISLRIAGIYDHSQALAVFLSNEQYCEIFDMDSDAFTGYLSDSEITDIDEDEIATVITEHDITKMCDQLDHSMGSYMTYFQYLCILLSAVIDSPAHEADHREERKCNFHDKNPGL